MENKTYDKSINAFGDASMQDELEEDIPITERIEPVKPKAPPPPAPEKIEIVEDEKEVEETVIESTETDETEAVEVEEIEEVEEAEEILEDVPFAIIEEVPVFPGCTGTRAQKSKCLNEKIKKHVVRRFNDDLAGDLGLSPGKKKIWVVFRIDPKGNITEIQCKSTTSKIKERSN